MLSEPKRGFPAGAAAPEQFWRLVQLWLLDHERMGCEVLGEGRRVMVVKRGWSHAIWEMCSERTREKKMDLFEFQK